MITERCNKCNSKIAVRVYEDNNWICNYCKDKKVVEKEITNKVIETTEEKYNWLQLYTVSYLHNNLKKNLNSIKQEKICIKYKDKYILHEDIIKQFKDSIV